MPKKSKFYHLKDDVWGLFSRGQRPTDIFSLHPYKDIPRQTVYDWYNEYRAEYGMVETRVELVPVANLEVTPHTRTMTDFEITRYLFRTIIEEFVSGGDTSVFNTQSAIQAGLAMMRLIPMQLELPEEILTGRKDDRVRDEEQNVSDDERMQRILKRLSKQIK